MVKVTEGSEIVGLVGPEEIILPLGEVLREVERATAQHGPMRSSHEAYAVLLEEVDEFWDLVKQRAPKREAMREELVHIAAMAVRALMDLQLA